MPFAYDFSKAKRGALIPATGKTRTTLFLDDPVIQRYKALSEKTGKGYQTLINEALNEQLGWVGKPVTPDLLRRIVREELAVRS